MGEKGCTYRHRQANKHTRLVRRPHILRTYVCTHALAWFPSRIDARCDQWPKLGIHQSDGQAHSRCTCTCAVCHCILVLYCTCSLRGEKQGGVSRSRSRSRESERGKGTGTRKVMVCNTKERREKEVRSCMHFPDVHLHETQSSFPPHIPFPASKSPALGRYRFFVNCNCNCKCECECRCKMQVPDGRRGRIQIPREDLEKMSCHYRTG